MKAQLTKPRPQPATGKPERPFASKAEFLAAEMKRFNEVFGNVDWEKARRDGLIR